MTKDDLLQTELRVTVLERRRVLNGDPAGVQELMALDAGGGMDDGVTDVFRISEEDGRLHVDHNNERIASIEPSQATKIQIVGSGDDDVVELDVTDPFLRSAGLSFMGGGGENSLRIMGQHDLTQVGYELTGDAGRIHFQAAHGQSLMQFTETTAIEDHLAAGERSFELSGDHDRARVGADESGADEGFLALTNGDVGVKFATPSNRLSFDLSRDGTSTPDSIEFHNTSFDADLSIVAGAEDDVSFHGRVELRGGDLAVDAGSIEIDGEVRTEDASVSLDAARDTTLSHDGRIQNDHGETTIHSKGDISLDGDIESTAGRVVAVASHRLDVSGEIDVSTDLGHGGQVELSADDVSLNDAALIDASGDSGGGTVHVGRSPSTGHVTRLTSIGHNAGITADAGHDGDGGEIIIWSTEETSLLGIANLTARGGVVGGDGGFIETSGRHIASINGAVDVGASSGQAGTWLIDPIDVVIRTGGATSVPPAGGTLDSDTEIDAASLVTALAAGATVTIRTDGADDGSMGDINVESGLDAMALAATGTLNLVADNDIIIEAGSGGIVAASGAFNLNLTATGDVAVDNDIQVGATGTISATATNITMADGTTLSTMATVNLQATESIALGAIDATTVTLTADSDNDGTGAITDNTAAEAANVTATSVTFDAGAGIGAAADADIDTAVDSLQATNRTANSIVIQETNGLNLTAAATQAGGGDVTITATAGAVVVSGAVTADGAGSATIGADAGSLTLSASVTSTTGGVNLSGESIQQSVDISTGGAIGFSATNGSITMADGTTTDGGTAVDYFATDDVLLSRVVSQTADVTISADNDNSGQGAIFDNSAAETANVSAAAMASLFAAEGIGASGAGDIDLEVTTLNAANSTSGDAVFQEANGLTVAAASTGGGNGDVLIGVDAGNLTISGAVAADGSGDVSATAAAGNLDVNAGVSSTSGDITLSALVIQQAADITTAGSVSATASAGDLTMVDGTTTTGGASVNYQSINDVLLSAVNGGAGTVSVTADSDGDSNGAIIDNTAGEAANVAATGGATLSAATGIGGAAAADLDTSLGSLAANNSTSGDVRIENSGVNQLTISNVTNPVGVVEIDQSGGLTVSSSVTAQGNVRLTTIDDNADVPPQQDDLTVAAGANVQSATGDVLLQGGDDVTIAATATISAANAISIHGDFGNADAAGSLIEVRGTLTAGVSPTIEGDSDADTFTIAPSNTNVIQIFGRNPAAAPGDTLNAVTPAGEAVQLNQTSASSGSVAFTGGAQDLDYVEIENIAIGGIVTITGTGDDDTLTINATGRDSATTTFTTNGVPPAGVNPNVGFFELVSLVFDALGGDDQLTINHPANDVFAPTGGITYVGGPSAGDALFNPPGDRLTLTGPAVIVVDVLEHRFDPAVVPANGTDGVIRYQDAGVGISLADSSLTYTGVDTVAPDPAIIDSMNVAARVFDFTTAAETITLADDGGVAGSMRVESNLTASVRFANSTASTTLDTSVGTGSDTINVEGLDAAYDADLSVLGDADDDVTFQTNSTNVGPGNRDLVVTGRRIDVTENLVASGIVDLQAEDDIDITATSSITAVGAGGVTVIADADGDANGAGGQLVMNDGSFIDAGSGNVTLSSDEDLLLTRLLTTGNVQATSTSGAIVDNTAAETTNIDNAGTVTLSAATGIGGSGAADLDTLVGTVAASTGANDVVIQELDGLVIAGAVSNGGNGLIDIDVDAGNATVTAPVAANGSGTVNLDVFVGSLTIAGAISSGTGAITLNANAIQQNADVATGGAVSATASVGSIVMTSGTSTTAGAQLDYTAAANLAISALITTGVAVNLTADSDGDNDGAISDTSAAETANVSAPTAVATMTAATGIGGAGAADIDTNVATLFALNSTSGDLVIQEQNALVVTNAVTQAGNGDVSIDVDAGDLLVTGPVTADGSGDVTLNADGGTVTFNVDVTSTSGNVTISGDQIQQNANVTTMGAVSMTADTASISMANGTATSADGQIDYAAATDVEITTIVSAAASVSVIADSDTNGTGAIDDVSPGEAANITAMNLILAAANGIGAAGVGDIDTVVDAVTATNSTSNGIHIQEANALTINGASTAGGNGEIVFDVDNGDVTVAGPVSANGTGPVTIDVNAGALTLDADVSSAAGAITLLATALTQNANVSTTGAVTAVAATGSIAMADGTTTTAGGQLTYMAAIDVLVSSLMSTGGDLMLTADSDTNGTGAISDNTAAEGVNVAAAGAATLSSALGIGGIGVADIDTDVGSLQATNTIANDIVIEEADGVIITGITTLAGNGNIDVDVNAGNASTTGVMAADGAGVINLNVDLGSLLIGAAVNSTSGNITVMADAVQQNAGIVTAGVIAVTADNGSIVMADGAITSGGGQLDYVATENVTLGTLATTGVVVNVLADSDNNDSGAIADGTALESANILAGFAVVTLEAADGVGGAGDADIDTQIAAVSIDNSASGDVGLQEANGLTVLFATNQGGGDVEIVSDTGPISVDGNVTVVASGEILLAADDGNLTMNAQAISVDGDITGRANLLVLDNATPIQTDGGSVDLTDADRVRLDVDVTIETTAIGAAGGDVRFSTNGTIESQVPGVSALAVVTRGDGAPDGAVDLTDMGGNSRLESLFVDAGVATVRLRDSADPNDVMQIRTEGGTVELIGNIRLTDSVTIDTNGTVGQDAGNVDLSNASLGSNVANADLIVNTSVVDGSAAGNVQLSQVGDAMDATYIRQLRINATSANPVQTGEVRLGGPTILLDSTASGSSLFEVIGSSDVILESDLRIDTKQSANASDAGDVRLGNTFIVGDADARPQLVIDTSATAQAADGGNVTLGRIGTLAPLETVGAVRVDASSVGSQGGNIHLMGSLFIGRPMVSGHVEFTTSGFGRVTFSPGNLIIRVFSPDGMGDISGDVFLDLANNNDDVAADILQSLQNTLEDRGQPVLDQGLIVAPRAPSDSAPQSPIDPQGNAAILVRVVDDFAGENLEVTVDWFRGVPEEFRPQIADPLIDRIISYPTAGQLNANEDLLLTENYRDFFTTSDNNFMEEAYLAFADYANSQNQVVINVTATFDPRFAVGEPENGIVFRFIGSTVDQDQNQILTVDLALLTPPEGLGRGPTALPPPVATSIEIESAETLNVSFEFAASEPELAQSQVAGVTTGATSERPARYYELRIVTYDESGGVTELPLSLTVSELLSLNRGLDDDGEADEFDPSQLPELFRRLPDDRYRLYLIEEGAERLILDFMIRQGQPTESQDISTESLDQDFEDVESEDEESPPGVTWSEPTPRDSEPVSRLGLGQRIASLAGRMGFVTHGDKVLHTEVPTRVENTDWGTSINRALEKLGNAVLNSEEIDD